MRLLCTLASSLVLSACGCSPAESGSSSSSTVVPPAAYDGPVLKASIETAESHPPQFTLIVDIYCPTGGFKLQMAEFDSKSTPREAKFILTSPATDELVIQAFENHVERIDLGTERTPVRVLVSQRQRRNPETDKNPFQLATSVTPR